MMDQEGRFVYRLRVLGGATTRLGDPAGRLRRTVSILPRLATAAGATIALLGILLPSAAAQPKPIPIDIAAMQAGLPPAGFSFARTGSGTPAQWRVVADPSATGGKAIEQISADITDYRFPLAIYDAVSAKSLAMTLRFKPIAGRIDQAGGIAIRLRSPGDYYVLRANALEDNVNFYRVVGGSRQQLQGAGVSVAGNAWHTLELRSADDRFTAVFDGKELFTVRDGTFPGAGRVGLWTKADSVTEFDTISITPTD